MKRICVDFILISIMLMTTGQMMGQQAMRADYQVVPMPQSIELQKGKPFALQGSIESLVGTPALKTSVSDRLPSEGYRLTVSRKGIEIVGGSEAGVFYGMQTLRKSLPVGTQPAIELPAVIITDEPRFAYRGMHLDCARHFFTVNEVKKYLDMMALHNMNRFHWHLTDDQGWRIEIKKYPRLTEFGSKRTGTVIGYNSDVDDHCPYGGFYTQEEIKKVIAYAQERHITIIPEIDMPGHTLAALACFPELGCTGGPYEVGHKWGAGYEVLCVGNPRSLEFAKDVLTEVMALFPSEVIHIGGDETPTNRWGACEKCKALGVASVQGYFTHELEEFLAEHGRKAIGWDEMLERGVDTSTMIMSWRGSKPGCQAAAKGHDVVMSPLTHCYLDYYQTSDTRYEPSVTGMWPIDVEKVYSFDPAPDSIPVASREHIIGAQGNIWTKHIVNFDVVEYQALPRMSALAEVQWTMPERKDWELFKERLTRFTKVYEQRGWTYAKHLWPERMVQDRWHF